MGIVLGKIGEAVKRLTNFFQLTLEPYLLIIIALNSVVYKRSGANFARKGKVAAAE